MKTRFTASTVFRKFVMGVTGLLLVGFIVSHLSANVLLYQPSGALLNEYTAKLASFGPLLYIAEAALAFFFVYHAVTGIRLARAARAARPVRYAGARTKGGESKWGFAANNMAITGAILFIFLVLHVIHFKYGPGVAEGYTTTLANGQEGRDLSRHVREQFQNPLIVAGYTLVMAMLGMHLRHGIWSALQSLGLTRPNNSMKLYVVGGAIGVLLGAGFLLIPLYLYFFGGAA